MVSKPASFGALILRTTFCSIVPSHISPYLNFVDRASWVRACGTMEQLLQRPRRLGFCAVPSFVPLLWNGGTRRDFPGGVSINTSRQHCASDERIKSDSSELVKYLHSRGISRTEPDGQPLPVGTGSSIGFGVAAPQHDRSIDFDEQCDSATRC